MAAPANNDWTTATNIASLPYSNTQSDIHDAGTTYSVWYKYTAASATERVIGIFGFGDLTVYRPTVEVYTISGGIPVRYLSSLNGINKPIQIPVSNAITYYFKFIPNAGNPTPAVLTLDVRRANRNSISVGSIFVPDDVNFGSTIAEGLPGIFLSSLDGDDYNVLNFISPLPNAINNGTGDSLASTGRYLLSDDYVDFNMKLYDNQLNFLTNVANFGTGSPRVRAQQTIGAWWVGWSGGGGTNAKVRKVNNAGAFGATTYDLGSAGLTALAANNDETVLYFSGLGSSLNSQISRWDLSLNVAMSDLVADFGGTYKVFDILVLSDGSIIVGYFQSSDKTIKIRHYNGTTGAVLHSYDLGSGFTSITPALAYSTNNSTSFWVWLHLSTGISKFREVEVSTGNVLSEIEYAEYEDGSYEPAETATPLARFGNSQSCPFMLVRTAITVTNTDSSVLIAAGSGSNQYSGIYQMVPSKRNDTLYTGYSPVTTEDVKIPNPFVRIPPLGE